MQRILMYIKYIQDLCQSRFSAAIYALFLVATATTAGYLNGRMLDRCQPNRWSWSL
jgi:hypothetical protein